MVLDKRNPPLVLQIEDRLSQEMAEAEQKAWDSLSRYKFWMFGYWAAMWVHLNHISGQNKPNPFQSLVKTARNHLLSRE